MKLATIADHAEARGLALRGAFHPMSGDGIHIVETGTPAQTIVLLGFVGRSGWPQFSMSTEATDGGPDPLDRWSRRIMGGLAKDVGAAPLYPFDGPPWHPFQAWAMRADAVMPSPMGLLIHPVFGLWHSYRGALAFAERLDLPERAPAPSPCTSCVEKPCLTACPVGAFRPDGYDVMACRAHVASSIGVVCMRDGCLARRACPVGREHAYGAEQTAFLMRAFIGRSPG